MSAAVNETGRYAGDGVIPSLLMSMNLREADNLAESLGLTLLDLLPAPVPIRVDTDPGVRPS